MDRIFRKFGLFGKIFYSNADSESVVVFRELWHQNFQNDRNRKMTIIATTFVPCGEKLPIIALIAERCLMDVVRAEHFYFVGIGNYLFWNCF